MELVCFLVGSLQRGWVEASAPKEKSSDRQCICSQQQVSSMKLKVNQKVSSSPVQKQLGPSKKIATTSRTARQNSTNVHPELPKDRRTVAILATRSVEFVNDQSSATGGQMVAVVYQNTTDVHRKRSSRSAVRRQYKCWSHAGVRAAESDLAAKGKGTKKAPRQAH